MRTFTFLVLVCLALVVPASAHKKKKCEKTRTKIVVFGDSLSDTGIKPTCKPCDQYTDGATADSKSVCQHRRRGNIICKPASESCQCLVSGFGIVGAIKKQKLDKLEAWTAASKSVGYNKMRWTNRKTWPEYLARLYRREKCGRSQVISYAVGGAQASVAITFKGGQMYSEKVFEGIQVGPVVEQVDTYLAGVSTEGDMRERQQDDLLFFFAGANDLSEAAGNAQKVGHITAAYYTAAATYFATTVPPVRADAVAAILAAAATFGIQMESSEADAIVAKLVPALSGDVPAFIAAEAQAAGGQAAGAKIQAAIVGVVTAVSKLSAFKNVYVLAPPPLGISPFAMGFGPAATAAMTAMSAQFSAALKSALPASVRYLDQTAIISEFILEHDVYKTDNPTDLMCFWTTKEDGTSVPKTAEEEKAKRNCKGYAFVDDRHPAATVHKKMATLIYNELAAPEARATELELVEEEDPATEAQEENWDDVEAVAGRRAVSGASSVTPASMLVLCFISPFLALRD